MINILITFFTTLTVAFILTKKPLLASDWESLRTLVEGEQGELEDLIWGKVVEQLDLDIKILMVALGH